MSENLAEKFLQYVKLTQRAGIEVTWDNFYEWAKVPEEKRNNKTATKLKNDLIELQRAERELYSPVV